MFETKKRVLSIMTLSLPKGKYYQFFIVMLIMVMLSISMLGDFLLRVIV
jgi:hypothetical protein